MRSALPFALAGSLLLAQAPKSPDPVAAAREIMAAARYCTLVTLDRRGAPDARMMDAFPMEADGSIWMATKAGSRKALQIRRDPRVNRRAGRHVHMVGPAVIVERSAVDLEFAIRIRLFRGSENPQPDTGHAGQRLIETCDLEGAHGSQRLVDDHHAVG